MGDTEGLGENVEFVVGSHEVEGVLLKGRACVGRRVSQSHCVVQGGIGASYG